MVRFRPVVSELPLYVPGMVQPGATKLSSNENPLGTSHLALHAVRELLASGVNRYPDGSALHLRTELAARWNVEIGQVIVGNGSDELLALAATGVVAPGDSGVCARHTFSVYAFVVQLMGGVVRLAAMQNGICPPEEFLDAIDDSTRILFVCNPNNPTGGYLSGARLRRLLKRLPAHILVVVDEAYADFAAAPDFVRAVEMVADFDNLLVLGTFSKLYGMASLRVGYGIGQTDLIDMLQRVRLPFNVNAVAQTAAIAALRDTDFVRRTLALVHRERAYLHRELERIGLYCLPSQANFVCVRIGAGATSGAAAGGTVADGTALGTTVLGDAATVAAALAQHGITIRALGSFGMPDWLRISVGLPEENRRVVEIIRTLLGR